jgi:predicted TIM-barrel fold metal-dependent hydrolase
MVGTNFPIERLAGDFGSLYELVVAGLQDLSDQQRADVSPAPRDASTGYRSDSAERL